MKIALTFAAVAGLLVPASSAVAAPAAHPGRADTPVPTTAAAPAAAAPATAAGTGTPATGTATGTPATATDPGAPATAARPGTPATAAPAGQAPGVAAPAGQGAAAAAPLLVARWDFNAGAVGGRVADTSGRGPVLTVRAADQGTIRFEGGPTGGKYAAFPVACAAGATVCPRGLLEAADDAELNPGVRLFRWSARVHLVKDQIRGSSNVMQKGVSGTGSLWKMQIGATSGRAQCVVSGAGSSTLYIARSAATVADGLWHKILCQRAGTNLAVYVDNVQRGQTAIPATLTIGNALPLRIGGPNFNTSSDMYHGLLDDVYAELG